MLEYILFVFGLALLIKGGDWLVDGASSLAKRFGVPALVIGLTIVAFGTSLPEMIVSIMAVTQGSTDIAFGNIVGSNIANILLILGLAAAITPIAVQRSTIWKEIPFSFLAAALLFSFALGPYLDGTPNAVLRSEGLVLLMVFCIFLYYVIEMARAAPKATSAEMGLHRHSGWIIALMLVGGLAALYFGGRWTVDGAVAIARQLGLSEFLISATIIAIGTSLPELVTTVMAARKNDVDLAVGNIIGSNIFNILWVMGVTAIIAPVALASTALIDLGVLLGVTFLLFAFMFLKPKHELRRWQGITFLVLYAGYLVFLVVRG
jgi:cation:H+ antiporter